MRTRANLQHDEDVDLELYDFLIEHIELHGRYIGGLYLKQREPHHPDFFYNFNNKKRMPKEGDFYVEVLNEDYFLPVPMNVHYDDIAEFSKFFMRLHFRFSTEIHVQQIRFKIPK